MTDWWDAASPSRRPYRPYYNLCDWPDHEFDPDGKCDICGGVRIIGWMVTWNADHTIKDRAYRLEADAHADAADLRAAGMSTVRVSTFNTPSLRSVQWWDRQRGQLAH